MYYFCERVQKVSTAGAPMKKAATVSYAIQLIFPILNWRNFSFCKGKRNFSFCVTSVAFNVPKRGPSNGNWM